MVSRSGADMPADMRRLLGTLEGVEDDLTVYVPSGAAVTPDTPVAVLDEDVEEPPGGMAYLLEVGLIKEVIEVWRDWRDGAEPSVDQACEAVSYYSRHDAYQPVS